MVEIKIMTNNLITNTYVSGKNIANYWSHVKLNAYLDDKLYDVNIQPSNFDLSYESRFYCLDYGYVYSVEVKKIYDGKIEPPQI